MAKRDFLNLLDLAPGELKAMLPRAAAIKSAPPGDPAFEPLKNRSLAMLFEKPSTRTRVSFEVAMTQLGGNAIFLSTRDTQLGRGEPVADSARVLARMVDAIMIRNDSHATQQTLASHADVPVINGLSDLYHPCQVLADMLTFHEHRGDIEGRNVAWIGDGNNMCHSYINGAIQFGYSLRIAAPPGYQPDPDIMARAGDRAALYGSAEQATAGADLVITDVWASMGQDQHRSRRLADFRDFQVHAGVMAAANPGALFMHCLPAHRGEEVAAEVIDGPQSVVWDEAGNRLHAQKALLECLLC